MSFNTALNPSVVKTVLDDVAKQEFDYQEFPGHADATNNKVFKQSKTTKAAEIQEVFKGVSLFAQYAEEADVPEDQPRITNQKTFSVLTYGSSIDIPKNFFDDQMHGSYSKMVQDFAMKARLSRDDNAFERYRGSFATYTTADDSYIVADSHTTINGGTVDNKLTAALSESSLNDAVTKLIEQKDQADVVVGGTPAVLLVPPKLFKTACEVVESQLRSGTADNDLNYYSSKHPGMIVLTSNRLGAANTSGTTSGSDTAWWVLGRNHMMTRWVRQALITDLVPYQNQRNNNYIYKANFREITGCMDYVGIVGSTGAGA